RWVRGIFDDRVTHALGVPSVGPVESDMSDKPRYLRRLPDLNAEEKSALTELSRQRAESLFVLDRQIGVVLQRLQKLGEYDRTARWKYVRYSTGEVELYDLKEDPLELQSRQDDPSYDGVRRKLQKVWEQYYDCKGAGCAEPLPPEFRATVAQTKAITDNEYR